MGLSLGRFALSPLLPILSLFLFSLGYGTVWGLFILAALLHESGHLLALHFCGVPVYSIRIGALGARIETPPLTCRQELICAAAGPAMNALCLALLFLCGVKLFALLHAILMVYNLLPVYPLDGGRLLYALAARRFADRSLQIARLVSIVFCTLLIAFAVPLAFRARDPLPAIAAAVITLRAWTEM